MTHRTSVSEFGILRRRVSSLERESELSWGPCSSLARVSSGSVSWTISTPFARSFATRSIQKSRSQEDRSTQCMIEIYVSEERWTFSKALAPAFPRTKLPSPKNEDRRASLSLEGWEMWLFWWSHAFARLGVWESHSRAHVRYTPLRGDELERGPSRDVEPLDEDTFDASPRTASAPASS